MSFVVSDIDRGWGKIKREVKKPNSAAYVGIRGKGSGKDSLATIAWYHEHGGTYKGKPRPPKRAFFAPEIDNNQIKYWMLLAKISDRVYAGLTTKRKGLFALGAVVEKRLQARIRNGIAPKLAASTILAKSFKVVRRKKRKDIGKKEGFTYSKKRVKASGGLKVTPLIHTGRLLNSITHWLGK